MNEKVEEIYTQMFAPQEIPQAVRDLYARAQRFADRIDSPQMPVSMLVTIAACATVTAKSAKPAKVDIDEVGETIPVQPDSYASNEAPEPSAERSNDEVDPNAPPEGGAAATGPMDVPAVHHKGDELKMVKDLMRMTKDELRAHAKEFYGYRPRLNYSKNKIIEMLKLRKPIK
jgi:hypothetical protein